MQAHAARDERCYTVRYRSESDPRLATSKSPLPSRVDSVDEETVREDVGFRQKSFFQKKTLNTLPLSALSFGEKYFSGLVGVILSLPALPERTRSLASFADEARRSLVLVRLSLSERSSSSSSSSRAVVVEGGRGVGNCWVDR
ncbi:hypothetical protein R1flu_025311 [Riccia fluitans]|uniref:Uncharacterized protein n=1 Tax=Riccia fluitans TaxID=41844 RepID=A0ABD1XXT8_9MARC